jgi:outer membrane protein TolC
MKGHKYLVLLAAMAAVAASPAPSVLTLEEAIFAALQTDGRLAIAAATIDAAAAESRQAGANRMPRIEFGYMFQRTNNPVFVFGNLLRQGNFTVENFDIEALNNPDPISNFTPQISVVQPLWTGGRIARREEAAELAIEAAGLEQARTRQIVIFETVEAYSGAVLATRHLAVAKEALTTAEAHVELAQRLREGGLVVDSDVLQAQVRASEAREAVVRARSGLAVATSALNFMIGEDLATAVTLPEDLDEMEAGTTTLEPLVSRALATRPDLRAATAHEQAVAKNIEAEEAAFKPEFGLQGFAESNSDSMFGHQSLNWGVTVGAKFTIFEGNGRDAVVDKAMAQKRQVQYRAERLRRAIALEVTEAFYDAQAAAERVIQAETAIELARENLRIVENRYREGLSASVEMLEAQTALTRAQTRAVGARRDLMLGHAALDLAVGQ